MIWFTRFLDISRGQWFWMIAGIVLGVAVIAANTLLMAVSGWFIASMAMSGSSGVAFNYFFPSGSIRFLAIARTVGRYVERLVTHEATFRVLSNLRLWLFKRFVPLAPACLERYAGGDVAGRLRADVDALENLYLRIIAPLAVAIISLVLGLLFLYWFSPASAAAMLFFLTLSGVMLPLLVFRLAKNPGRRVAALSAELRNKVTDGLYGSEELILLGAAERQAAHVDGLSAKVIIEQERMGRIGAVSFAGMSLFAGCAIAAVLITAGTQVSSHFMPPANLVMLLLFSAALFEAVGLIPPALQNLASARESASRIFTLADAPIPVPETPRVFDLPRTMDITFTNVFAAYQSDVPVLHNISMHIPTGGCVVVTGSSGIGKSLIVEILVRFRDYAGSITVGGAELRELPHDMVRGMMSFVPQHPHLFNGTIRENILLGNESADEKQIDTALRDSCLDTWISGLPSGLDTQVGMNGSAVSGGEARRIALARALLKNAPILLLDEPTEGLDSHTEQEIVSRLLNRFRQGAETTVVVVSHRPACLVLGESVSL